MVARIRRNFCQYSWAPMWDHCGRKDLKASNRCYGKDWKVAGGCG